MMTTNCNTNFAKISASAITPDTIWNKYNNLQQLMIGGLHNVGAAHSILSDIESDLVKMNDPYFAESFKEILKSVKKDMSRKYQLQRGNIR